MRTSERDSGEDAIARDRTFTNIKIEIIGFSVAKRNVIALEKWLAEGAQFQVPERA